MFANSPASTPPKDPKDSLADANANAKPKPYTDQKLTKKGKPVKQRDTHFVCFPLVTEPGSISQLAESLRVFRERTTVTGEVLRERRVERKRREETGEKDGGERKDGEDKEGDRDEGEDGGGGNEKGQASAGEEGGVGELRIIPAGAHRPPGTFHLTIGTMNLSEKENMDRAVELLKKLDLEKLMDDTEREMGYISRRESQRKPEKNSDSKQQAESNVAFKHEESVLSATAETIKEKTSEAISTLTRAVSPPPVRPKPPSSPSDPLVISLVGLSAFQSPRKARVFYAPPHDPTDRLLLLANKIRNVFKAEGFVTEKRELTLHATVANMSHANKNKRGGRGGKQVRRMDIVEGTGVVKEFGGGEGRQEEDSGYIWARDIVVDRIHICKMGAEKSDDPVLGMVYPAIKTEAGEVAEVRLG